MENCNILFGCIFNKAWHFPVSKQAEINLVNMKNLNRRRNSQQSNIPDDLDNKTDHSCNISLEQVSSYYIPKPLAVWQYQKQRIWQSSALLLHTQSHPFLPCKSEPVLTRCGHSTVGAWALSDIRDTSPVQFCLRLYIGFGSSVQGCSLPSVTITLNCSSRTNSSTYPQTTNFWSPDQMEFSRAGNACLLKENNFSHLNIRASTFHHLLKYFKKTMCVNFFFGILARSACLL